MQIHEITAIQEGLGTMLKTIGTDIKNAVKAPINKAKYMLNTPGSFTSARGETDARDKYYTDLVGQRQSQNAAATTTNLTAWANNLAGQWSTQPRPSSQTPVAAPVAAPAATVPAKPVAPAAINQAARLKRRQATPETGGATAGEHAKLPQKIAAAKQPGVTTEAFSNLPGAKPAVGGAVPASVTAKPAGIKAPPPLQSRYAQNFKTWVTSNVADTSSGLGLADVEKIPELSRTLNQALAQVVATQQDPKTNQAAVAQYLLIVGQAMQKLSAEQKSTQKQNNPQAPQRAAVTPLSSILNPRDLEALKAKAKDPWGAQEIKQELGLR